MKTIGGYFQLELNDNNSLYHDEAISLNTGRNALEFILRQYDFKKIYIPIYSCNVILQPIKKLGLAYDYYHIDERLLPVIANISKDEALLYVNYFGIMDSHLYDLRNNYLNLIVDNSQAFYCRPIDHIPTFYSPRKFFGLPDGGFAYVKHDKGFSLEKDVSIERISHLMIRLDLDAETGYNNFKSNDDALNHLPIREMSNFTQRVLQNINFETVALIRHKNFYRLHKKLGEFNILTDIIESSLFETPMVYPFLRKTNCELREHLNKNKIYNAVYWPSVKDLAKKDDFECFLLNNLIALPIDQRLNFDDIDRIINEVIFFING